MEETKRKRGRPTNDEIVAKPFTPHIKPQIKEKNKEKLARDAIRRADQLYKWYAMGQPNPLNLEDKDLTEEAKATWKYIFSKREDAGASLENHGSGRYRSLQGGEEVLDAFEGFCAYVRSNNFMKPFTRADGEQSYIPIVPNPTNLSMWLGISSRALRRSAAEMNPSQEAEYKAMLSDLLSDGAIVGAYNTSSTIFTLKNLCDWADKREDRVVQVENTSTVDEAKRNLAELGYVRPKLLEGSDE